MSGKKVLCILGVLLPALFVSSMALGWSGATHSKLAIYTQTTPALYPLWEQQTGVDINDVIYYQSEPPGNWHTQQWNDIVSRAYVESGGNPNGNWWWGLDETTRLQYLMHNTTDVAVPVGHNPASINPGGYTDGWREFVLETRVHFWDNVPDIDNTCIYTHAANGHSYSLTGTISQVVSTFYDACRDNMNYFKNGGGYVEAGWSGLTLGMMLQRAVFVDYFLAKQYAVANSESWYDPNWGYVWFDARDSYDTDNISWNSNGTYSNTGGGILEYAYDFNRDGYWDVFTTAPFFGVLPSDLVYGLGCPVNETFPYSFSVMDDEYKWSESVGYCFIPGGGLMAMPEPATMALLAVGGLALLRRRSR